MPDLHFLLSTEDYPCLAQELCKVLASQQTPGSEQVQSSSPCSIPHRTQQLIPKAFIARGLQ